MRRLLPALTVTLCSLLAACGGDDTGGSGSPTPSSTTTSVSPSPTPVTLTRTQLDAVLLTAADLGSGWSGDAPSDAEDEETSPSPGATPVQCDLDEMARRIEDPLYGREVALTNNAAQILISNQAEVYEAGDATAGFAEVNRTFAACNTFIETDAESGEKSTLTKQPLDVGTYGDETFAITLAESGEDGFTGGLVMIRKGDVVLTVAGFSSGGTPTEALRTATQKAYAKLEAVLAGGGTTTATSSPGGGGSTASETSSPTASATSS